MLQMKDFFKAISASNRAKIRHLKIEFDAQSAFLGHLPFPHHCTGYSGYSAVVLGGILAPGGNAIRDAINMVTEVKAISNHWL